MAADLDPPRRLPSPEDLDAIASACAFLANLLLRVEAGPTALARLDHATLDQWPLRGRDPATDAGLEQLRLALDEARGSGPDEGALEADFRRLFVGPGHLVAPPWESVHVSGEGLTFAAQTLDVRRAYAEFGLEAPALHREPDDHVGLELAFVGELAVAALRAADAGDVVGQTHVVTAMARFAEAHLAVWVPGFARLVAEHADTALYRGVGLLLDGAVAAFVRLLQPVAAGGAGPSSGQASASAARPSATSS